MADKEKTNEQDAQERKPIKLPVNSQGYIDVDKLTPEELEEYNANLDEINTAAEIASGVATQIYNDLQDAKQNIKESKANGQLDELQEIFPDTMAFIESRSKIRNGFGILATWTAVLSPVFSHFDNFKEHLKEIGYTGTLEEFITPEEDPETGETGQSLFDLWQAEVEPESVNETLPIVPRSKAQNSDFPLDKINDTIFNNLKTDGIPGQITMNIKAENSNAKKQKEINLLYSINFDSIESDLPIVQHLTQYDKRVYIAIGAISNTGQSIMSETQILRAMGYVGNISPAQIERLDKSLTKFAARITIDNRQEIAAGYHYPRFVYDGDLLPFERIRAINEKGKVIDSAIHIFREPPLLSFAKGRGQITTVNIGLLQSPLNKTEENLAIENYLIERIARAKSGAQPKKILLSTVYEHAGIADKPREKRRAPEKIKTLLEHYKKGGYIRDYKMDKSSIILDV